MSSSSGSSEELCTVMSVRSRITLTSHVKPPMDAATIASIVKAISIMKSKAVSSEGAEVSGEWHNLMVEIARQSKPQVSGPFLSKDLESGNVYTINMIIGGPLNTKDNNHGRVMTLRTGPLYDTPHYTAEDKVDILLSSGKASVGISASVATVKRPRSSCEKLISQYIILPKEKINPPNPRSSG
ncbi:ORF4 [Coffee ringspot virus]|uniref:ORF4 n=1 Tax=Coffee ringspot virus TaxID=745716 RepID=W5UZ88_9RHAB|nr:ORF4 [Coffee ringspot virus]AHH44828.1 ORF4 [Coffee ringspot virus]